MYDIGATEINDFLMERWFKDEDYTVLAEPDCRLCIHLRRCDTAGEVKSCSAYCKRNLKETLQSKKYYVRDYEGICKYAGADSLVEAHKQMIEFVQQDKTYGLYQKAYYQIYNAVEHKVEEISE